MKKIGTLIAGVIAMVFLVACGGGGGGGNTPTPDKNETVVEETSVQSLKLLTGGYTFTLLDNSHVYSAESAYLQGGTMVNTLDHCAGIPEIDPENNGKDLLSDKQNHFTLIDYPSSGYGIAMNCVVNNLNLSLYNTGVVFDRNFVYTIYHDTGDVFLTHVNNASNDQSGLKILVLPGDLTVTTITHNGVTYSDITIYEEGGQKVIEYDSDAESIGGHYRIVFEVPYGIVEFEHTK